MSDQNATPEEIEDALKFVAMVKDALAIGYDIRMSMDGAYGSGQVNLWLVPAITREQSADWAEPEFYPTESEFGLGDEPEEAMIFAIAGTSLAEKYGWEAA